MQDVAVTPWVLRLLLEHFIRMYRHFREDRTGF